MKTESNQRERERERNCRARTNDDDGRNERAAVCCKWQGRWKTAGCSVGQGDQFGAQPVGIARDKGKSKRARMRERKRESGQW